MAASITGKGTVTFANSDGTVLQRSVVSCGKMPAYKGKTPKKATDAKYVYEFAGWKPKLAKVSGDITYKAAYTKISRPGRAKVSSIISLDKSSANVLWTASSGARSYELQWRAVGGKWTSASVKGTSKVVKGLKTGQLYQFRVRGIAGSIKGIWSNVSGRYFRVVSLASVKHAGAGAVSVGWKVDPKANAGYVIIVRGKFGGKVIARKVVRAGATSAIVRGLTPGQKVWVRVRSLRSFNDKTYIGILSAGRYVRL